MTCAINSCFRVHDCGISSPLWRCSASCRPRLSLGVTSTPIAQGQFGEIDAKTVTGDWHAKIDTKGQSDLFVLENRIIPGGTFGWHSHPRPSLVDRQDRRL